jgi:hypothetical protein
MAWYKRLLKILLRNQINIVKDFKLVNDLLNNLNTELTT